MKSSWKIVAYVGCLILICGAAITWHLLKAKAYRVRAEQGDARAQDNLGSMYYRGEGVPEDYTEALRWYRKAAEQGYARAQYDLGCMYYLGKGVPQDYAQAALGKHLCGSAA